MAESIGSTCILLAISDVQGLPINFKKSWLWLGVHSQTNIALDSSLDDALNVQISCTELQLHVHVAPLLRINGKSFGGSGFTTV